MAESNVPRWPGLVGTLASLAGIGVAGYLTYEHFTGSHSLVCSDHGGINCLAVTTSQYSKVLGIPVALLGLIYFVVMLVLQLPQMWDRAEPLIRRARVGWAVVGLVSVVYLLYTELFRIDAICLWCTGVHVLTFIVFVSTVLATLNTEDPLYEGPPGRQR
jgi:uncharacterized membrane protein